MQRSFGWARCQPWIRATLVLLCFDAGCSEEAGPKTYPVRGSVFVNGTPTQGMVVTFQNLDKTVRGNAAGPVAVTDKDGNFSLSTNADKDGAVEGEYVVLFYWASSNDTSAFDRFSGRFNKAEQSKFQLKIEPKETDLEPFRLEIDPKLIRPVREPAPGLK